MSAILYRLMIWHYDCYTVEFDGKSIVATMKRFIIIIIYALYGMSIVQAQTQPRTLDITIGGGTTKYWGEFTDDRFGIHGSVGLRYTIFPELFVGGLFGVGSTEFGVSPIYLLRYPDYYGNGAIIGQSRYNGSIALIEETNTIRVNTYEFMLGTRPFPSEPFSPYFAVGLGLLDWNITNSKEHIALPNNANEVYNRQSFIVPVGFGFDIYIHERLSLQAQALYRFTTTDFLDDYSESGSNNDGFASVDVGIAYTLFINRDRDNDGLTNHQEERYGTNADISDSDGDGLSDGTEIMMSHTNPLLPDTDGDGLLDGEEVQTNPLKADSDDDGLNDAAEKARGTDPLRADSDGDELFDADEIFRYGTDPLSTDTDDDGVRDGREVQKYASDPRAADTDNDGLNDGDEIYTTLTNVRNPDTDGDGLTDGMEHHTIRTDPLDIDTDRDGLNDGDEVMRYGSNPLQADTDMDGVSDADEIRTCSNPKNPDSDGDGIIDSKDSTPCQCNGQNTKTPVNKQPCPCEEKSQVPVIQEDKKQNSAPDMTEKKTEKRRFDMDIRFKVNSDELDFTQPQTSKNLETLKEYINQSCNDLRVVLEGHASGEGSAAHNKRLSELRARRIRRWLEEEGVQKNRILGTSGYGATRPRVQEPPPQEQWRYSPEQLEEYRKQNRRLTVRVEKDCV